MVRRAALALCIAAAAGCAPAAPPSEPGPAAAAGRVVRDSLWSQALGTTKHFLVYLPPSYGRSGQRYPVAYYLHGMWGSETDWTRQGALAAVADSLFAAGVPEMIVVMPDGDNGWYTTWNALGNYGACREQPPTREPAATFCVPWPHYDDYIARDLVAAVDSGYRTRAAAAHRGIAGLSMGGYGAISLALAYPDVFTAAASHSGVLTPLMLDTLTQGRDMETLFRIAGALAPSMRLAFGSDTAGWLARDPARRALRLLNAGRALPALYIDIGVGDRHLPGNRMFREFLERRGIPHRYHERAGAHTWTYWRDNLPLSMHWLASHIAG